MTLWKNLTISLIIILISSCSKSNDEENIILDGYQYKIWAFRRDSINSKNVCYFYFDNNHNCENMMLLYWGNKAGSYEVFPDEDAIVTHKWRIDKDTLFIQNIPKVVLRKTNDTIFLKDLSEIYQRREFLIDVGLPPKNLNSK